MKTAAAIATAATTCRPDPRDLALMALLISSSGHDDAGGIRIADIELRQPVFRGLVGDLLQDRAGGRLVRDDARDAARRQLVAVPELDGMELDLRKLVAVEPDLGDDALEGVRVREVSLVERRRQVVVGRFRRVFP